MILPLLLTFAPAPDEPITAIAFNLRYDNPSDPYVWSERLPHVADIARGADVVGTQEGLYHQVKDLDRALGEGWDWIGTGRDGGSRGEFMAIFFDERRFEPMEFDHFWLSDTPDRVGSATWGHSNRRMVTWVRLRERSTDEEFYVLNTHFDHRVAPAREKSATLVRERIGNLREDIPLVVTGDFNAAAEKSAPWRILVEEGPLEDAWLVAEESQGDVATFTSFKELKPGGARIDWVLVRGFDVRYAEAITARPNGVWPSDHLPVKAVLLRE